VVKVQKKKRSATNAQRAQMSAEAGLWTCVYKYYRCRAKYCKEGPYCAKDEQGNYLKLESKDLEAIFIWYKDNMKDGEREDDVDVNVEIPSWLLKDVFDRSRKRKADSSNDCRPCKTHCGHNCAPTNEVHVRIGGDREQVLKAYCNWTMTQTHSDRWRAELEQANTVALDQCLELNSVLQHPKTALDLLIKGGVKAGVALQWVSKSNIGKWWKESQHI